MKPLSIGLFVVSLTAAVMFAPDSPGAAGAADPPVVMAVIGDFGSGQAAEQRVADMIDTWNVDLITTVGDNVYSSDSAVPFEALDRKVGKYYHEYIAGYSGRFGAAAPQGQNKFFPALGNHDWGDPGVPLLNCSGGNCTGAWADFFRLPGNERYYDVRRGSLHLFVIDDYYLDPDGNSANSVQGRWLRDSLAASDAQWKIVVNHFPPYSSGGSNTRMRWPFGDWGVDAVISGHHHVYERLQIGDTLFFVNGLGGAGRGSFGQPPISGSQAQYSAKHGAQRVTATDTQLLIEFINDQGTIIDSVSRFANGGNPPPPAPDPAPNNGDVFEAIDLSVGGDYNVPAPDTTVVLPAVNSWVPGNVTLSGTAFHDIGVRQIEIVVRNTDNGRYWNPLAGRWQTKFYRFGIYASPRGWRNVTWSYELPAAKIPAGNYMVRAWARSWTGSGDNVGSNRSYFGTD